LNSIAQPKTTTLISSQIETLNIDSSEDPIRDPDRDLSQDPTKDFGVKLNERTSTTNIQKRSTIDHKTESSLSESVYNNHNRTVRKIEHSAKKEPLSDTIGSPNTVTTETDDVVSETDNVVHDIVLLTASTLLSALVSFLIKLIKVVCSCLVSVAVSVLFQFNLHHHIQAFAKAMFKITVVPIAESLYPVYDIERKFDKIVRLNREFDLQSEQKYEVKCDLTASNELTQQAWNAYVISLQKIKKTDYDMFDHIVSQQIDQVNFTITVAINRSNSTPRSIPFGMFYSKLFDMFGEAINTKYRYTTNKIFFVSIFKDEGPYRRLKYYDTF
ncbi:hypothetical protein YASMINEVIRUS_1475, partial [Yasminevirus sp. GU-2018]